MSSYLGIVILWFTQGMMYRMILEFIRCVQIHGYYDLQIVI